MTDQAVGHNSGLELERRSHLEATRVEPLGLQMHAQSITTMHRTQEVGLAVHHRQGHRWPLLLAAAAREDSAGVDAVTLQTLFPGFVAPAQQVMEVHHTGGIGVSEMNLAFQLEPVVL